MPHQRAIHALLSAFFGILFFALLSPVFLMSGSLSAAPNITPDKIKSVQDIYLVLQGTAVSQRHQSQIIKLIERRYAKTDLTKADHRAWIQKTSDGGGFAAWFMKAKPGSNVWIYAENDRRWTMKPLGNSGYFVAAEKFPNYTSVHFKYVVNGQRSNHGKNHRFGFESYKFGKMSLKQNGVPNGKLAAMGKYKAADKHYKGTERNWWLYVPAQYKPDSKPANLLVVNDGGWYIKGDGNVCTVLDNLIHAGSMPVTIAVFINPGEIKSPKYTIRNRGNEYDTCTGKFATFLEEEIISTLYTEYNISKKPEDRCIMGASSGASCAFTAAWHRNDLYGKVVSFIGSYCDFRSANDYPDYLRGDSDKPRSEYGPYKTAHDYPAMIRKFPRKNIRVFLQANRNDLDNNLGHWYKNNERMAKALSFTGYDYKFVSGPGMHSKRHGMSILPEALIWLYNE